MLVKVSQYKLSEVLTVKTDEEQRSQQQLRYTPEALSPRVTRVICL